MTDIHPKDKNFLHLTPFICSQTSLNTLNYPTSLYIQIEENPRYSAIYAILEIRIKAMEVYVCYLMLKG